MLRNVDAEPRTPEGRLIRVAIEGSGRSYRSVASEVPISDTRLRQWVAGTDAKGEDVPFPPERLGRVAQILKISARQLSMCGRRDAAKVLTRIIDEDSAKQLAKTLDTEEIARQLQSMAKRIGEIEQENEELRDRLEEIEGP